MQIVHTPEACEECLLPDDMLQSMLATAFCQAAPEVSGVRIEHVRPSETSLGETGHRAVGALLVRLAGKPLPGRIDALPGIAAGGTGSKFWWPRTFGPAAAWHRPCCHL